MHHGIVVSRDLLDPAHPLHPASIGEPACRLAAWIDLIGRARDSAGAGLGRGQARTSVRFLAVRWNWSVGKTHRFLADLEKDGRIAWERPEQGERRSGTITIVNYDTYNDADLVDRTRVMLRDEHPPERENERLSVQRSNDLPRSYGDTVEREQTHGGDIDPLPREREIERESPHKSAVSRVVESRSLNASRYKDVRDGIDVSRSEPNGSSLLPSIPPRQAGVQTTFDVEGMEPVPVELTPHRVATMMMGRWVAELPRRPPDTEIKKQSRAALFVANEYSPDEIVQAWRGMPLTWPWSDGRVWDMFDFRKSFGKAFQNAASHLDEDVRWEAFFNRGEAP